MITNFISSLRSFGAGIYSFLMQIGLPFTLTLDEISNTNAISYINPLSGEREAYIMRAVQQAVAYVAENLFGYSGDTVFFVMCLDIIVIGFFVTLVIGLVAWGVKALT